MKKPFFLHVTYTAPHWPLHAHEEDIARYEGKYRDGWDTPPHQPPRRVEGERHSQRQVGDFAAQRLGG